MPWSQLPLDLQWMIFDLIRDSAPKRPTTDDPPSQLPLVCRAWQAYFSHDNFRLIVLDQDRLDDFDRIVGKNKQRRKHVRQIIFRVKLPDYECDECEEILWHICMRIDKDTYFYESLREEIRSLFTPCENYAVFNKAVGRFMQIMSTWNLDDNEGIELEVRLDEPNNEQHSFQDCDVLEGHRCGSPPESCERRAAAIKEARGTWYNRLFGSFRIFGGNHAGTTLSSTTHEGPLPPYGDSFADDFAPTTVFNSLVISCHYRRQHWKMFLKRFTTQVLPNLRSFRHQDWIHVRDLAGIHGGYFTPRHRHWTWHWDRYIRVLDILPTTVEHFSVHHDYTLVEQRRSLLGEGPWRQDPAASRLSAQSAQPFTQLATRLKSLCASYAFRADYVLETSCEKADQFPKLEHLVLNSDILKVPGSPQVLERLLLSATTVAFRLMPNLKALVLWDGDATDNFIIRFCYTSYRQPTVVWSSTRESAEDLSAIFMTLRHSLAEIQPGKYLEIIEEVQNQAGTLGAGSTHAFDRLQQFILDPASAQQMNFEIGISH